MMIGSSATTAQLLGKASFCGGGVDVAPPVQPSSGVCGGTPVLVVFSSTIPGTGVGQIGRTFDGGLVDAVLDPDGGERRAGHDRVADDAMAPADQAAVQAASSWWI
jgi:hypothetical protein